MIVRLATYHANQGHIEAAKYVICWTGVSQVSSRQADLEYSIYFKQALGDFSLHTHNKPELALTKQKKANFLRAIGDEDGAIKVSKEVADLYRELRPEALLDENEFPQYEDLETLVPVWSR